MCLVAYINLDGRILSVRSLHTGLHSLGFHLGGIVTSFDKEA